MGDAGRVEILAHRGWWSRAEERNTLGALRRALAAGLGVETDVRDCAGEIVIAHDPPAFSGGGLGVLACREVLAAYVEAGRVGTLALNIKADGLQGMVLKLLRDYAVERYFVFDMSVADMRGWMKAGARVFTRQSEIEPSPVLYDAAAGVWLDAFGSDWYAAEVIERHLAAGKQVSVVSPELHGRDPMGVWRMLQSLPGVVYLCTDRVAEARRIFHGEH